MRAAYILGAVAMLAACSPTPTSPTETFPFGETATVVRIIDGDSLIAATENGEIEVRLLGVNAPEGSECHGDAARAALADLLSSGQVTLAADEAEGDDQFGRALRYLYAEDIAVNLALIAGGNANVVQGDHSRDNEFALAADRAAAQQLGMWAPAACGSEAPFGVVIVDYVYNPAGRDSDEPNGEWVAIANTADEPVDLSGWILRDESTQHRYRFPGGFSLYAGMEVSIHSGCGNDTSEHLYWCAGDPVWSNGGDTIILQLADGTVVDRVRYAGDS